MGLLDNTKNIELAITEKNKQERQKELEIKRKQQEKENKKRLENDIIREIKTEFDEAMRNNENIQKYYFNEKYYTLLNNIIREYSKTKNIIDYVTGEQKTKYINEYEIKDIYDKHYYKILKQKENIIKKQNDILLRNNKIIENEKNQKIIAEEAEKQKKIAIFQSIFIVISCIVFFPITFIILTILATCKASK